MALNILHLSDLHIGEEGMDLSDLASSISDSLKSDTKIQQIVFTGDIFDAKVNTSKSAREAAVSFVNELIDNINENLKLRLNTNDVIFISGNHEIEKKENEINRFSGYKDFLKLFYKDNIPDTYNLDNLSVFKKFDNEKIVIIGFNSACLDKDGETTYGEIKRAHRTSIERKLKDECKEYSLVVLLHHHFYIIEERQKDYQDKSNVINPQSFLNWLSKYNVAAILHGHKHDNSIKRININNNLKLGDKVVTTIAGGSAGKSDVSMNNFNVIRIYPPESTITLDVSEYEKKNTDIFDLRDTHSFPVQEMDKKGTLLTYFLNRHIECKAKWHDIRSFYSNSEEYIELLNKIIPDCSKCCARLEEEIANSSVVYMFAVAHCCANGNSADVVKNISKVFSLNKDDDFEGLYINLLNCRNIYELKDFYRKEEIQQQVKRLDIYKKQRFIFSVLSFYLSSFYYTLTRESKNFFNIKLKSRNDINLPEEYNMNSNVRVNDIVIQSDEEKRSVDVEVICTDPAAHKVISIIINEFESLLSYFEKDFASIGYNMYYIKGLVKSKSQNSFTSYNFSAYMHTLLKLLAGEHIYKDNKVFIRELIQNSIDAINMRKELEGEKFAEERRIDINYSEENGNHYLEIKDNGVGMTQFHIERYLTTVGRSFYKSEEFHNSSVGRKYIPISQFGIGFLSSFNVSKSIEVKTKYFDSNVEHCGKQLDIPSLDGCFFIENCDRDDIGTIVRLELDVEKITDGEIKDIDKFIDEVKSYIKDRFINIPANIYWKEDKIVPEYNLLNEIETGTLKNKLKFFIPLTDKGDLKIGDSSNTMFGIYLYKKDNDLYNIAQVISLCNGIKVEEIPDDDNPFSIIMNNYFDVVIDLSSHNVELDVSRDIIQKYLHIQFHILHDYYNKSLIQFYNTQKHLTVPYFIMNQIDNSRHPIEELSITAIQGEPKLSRKLKHSLQDAIEILDSLKIKGLRSVAHNSNTNIIFNNLCAPLLVAMIMPNSRKPILDSIKSFLYKITKSPETDNENIIPGIFETPAYQAIKWAIDNAIDKAIESGVSRVRDMEQAKAKPRAMDMSIAAARDMDSHMDSLRLKYRATISKQNSIFGDFLDSYSRSKQNNIFGDFLGSYSPSRRVNNFIYDEIILKLISSTSAEEKELLYQWGEILSTKITNHNCDPIRQFITFAAGLQFLPVLLSVVVPYKNYEQID